MAALLSICFAAVPLDGARALPDIGEAMTFVIVRSSAPGCEPVCPEWISAEGAILADTPQRFRKLLKKLGDRRLPVIILSPGGDIQAAIAIGRMVRERKLDVAVGRTRLVGCPLSTTKPCRPEQKNGQPLKGVIYRPRAFCVSACPLILAGGVKRLAGTLEYVGVHQITTYGTRSQPLYKTRYKVVNGKKKVGKVVVGHKRVAFETTELGKETRRKVLAHLRAMGVAETYLDISQRTKPTDMSRLSQYQMDALKLITALDDAGVLVGAEVCKATPLPANCRAVESEMQLSHIPLPTPRPTAGEMGVASASKGVEQLAAAASGADESKPVEAVVKPHSITDDMRFVVVRGHNSLCAPTCPEWISAEGYISDRSLPALRKVLDALGDRQLPILITSRGGDAAAAMAMGRLIRERELDVAVSGTRYVNCKPEEPGCVPDDGTYTGVANDWWAECRASCLLILASGVRRVAGLYVTVSVESLGNMPEVRRYLGEMGLNHLLGSFMYQSLSTKRELDWRTMREAKLSTGETSVDRLTGTSVCKRLPLPVNCRVVTQVQ